MDRARTTLIELLAEAHSNELGLVNTLNAHIRLAEPGSYKRLLESHLRETERHASKIERRLEQLGHRRNPITIPYEFAQNAVKQSMVLAKGPIDAVRGMRDRNEKMLRNARDEAMTEAMEIATYDTIEWVARNLGDAETADLAVAIRADEEEMLEALRREIPELAGAFARTKDKTASVGEPWNGYDEMTVDEIQTRLRDADERMALVVLEYEQNNKNRQTVIDLAERESVSV